MKARKDLDRMKSIATKLKNPSDSIAKFIEPAPAAVMKQQKESTLKASPIMPNNIEPGEPMSMDQAKDAKNQMAARKAGREAKKEARDNYLINKQIKEDMENEKDEDKEDLERDQDEDLVIEDI